MNYAQLLEEIKAYIARLFSSSDGSGLYYHNYNHTEQVVANAIKIAAYYELNDRDFFIVTAAAWFHDAGYYKGGINGHEVIGADLATEFLKTKGADEAMLLNIQQCILATSLPQHPQTQLEKILCDADLYHLGTENFGERNKLMKKEAEWRSGSKISKDEWRKDAINLLQSHTFHTTYGQNFLQQTQASNLKRLQLKAQEKETEAAEPVSTKTVEKASAKAEKSNRPDRGIETMFRITSSNNQRLSDMADNKANIMVTTTSIIMSILLSVLIRKLEENPNLTIPAILLLTICVITLVLAILATRPALPPGVFTDEDIKTKKVNLLFFGNFYKMPLDIYADGIKQVMNDREFLYGTLTKDIYFQGAVLGRKYRLLRAAYSVFMYGIVISVLAFIVASFFPGS